MALHRQRSEQINPSLEEFILSERLLNSNEATLVRQFISEADVNWGTAVMFLDLVSADRLGFLLEQRLGVPRVEKPTVALSVRKRVDGDTLRELEVVPINVIEESGQKVLVVGMTDPLNQMAISRMESLFSAKVQPAFLSLDELQSLYQNFYKHGLRLYPPEVTSQNPVRSRTRVEALGGVWAGQPSASTSDSHLLSYVEALVSLLEEKKILTRQDILSRMAELAK